MKPKKETRPLKPTPFVEQDLTDLIKEVHERTESPSSARSPDVRSDPNTHINHRHIPSYNPARDTYKPKKTNYHKN
jgi:hypothetical protein